MICKKCANIFDDSLLACPMCGWSVNGESKKTQNAEPFRVAIKDEDYNQPAIPTENTPKAEIPRTSSERRVHNPTRPVAFDEITPDGIRPHKAQHQAEVPVKHVPSVTRVTRNADGTVVKKTVSQRKDYPQRKPAQQQTPQKKAASERPKVSSPESSAKAAKIIVSVMCVLAVIMASLTVLGAKTEVFKSDGSSAKTVALSSLSAEDSGSLEKQLSDLGICEYYAFDSSSTTSDEFLALIRPYDSQGLYGRMYGNNTAKVTDTPDPDGRFYVQSEEQEQSYYGSEEKSYSYYKISQQEIDRILSLFSLPEAHTANDTDYYYCDGYYYFADKTQSQSLDSNTAVDVASGKRIDDGRYYVESSRLYSQSGALPIKTYLIVEKSNDSEMPWTISKISTEPLFDSTGKLIADDTSVQYEIKTQTIEAVTQDGTVYCSYKIRYPVFKGNSNAEKTATRMFSDMIKAVSSAADKADENYKAFVSAGGDRSVLPFVCETVVNVTYDGEDYLSVVKQTADNLPDLEQMKKDFEESKDEDYSDSEDESEQTQKYTAPTRTYEGYNLDKQTGDFVTKDNIIGKDYQSAYEILYRIYNSYDYTQVLDELSQNGEVEGEASYETEEKDYEEVPEDDDEIGKKIYDSANAMCDEGYAFYFVTSEGYGKKVVIPNEAEYFFSE